ncbi:MAG TPA: RagB/SusD family nutrient uptake outer membrane protein [Niabella sp.]|nr:RagB/SusD family nutrient uptake outer membrane protein [Niabella sp.]HQX72533.1 RagB/SusD family nutrient uptake outer membrane protein [Chitinophagaceae bacterium]HQW16279.1 RagB/SusD family nutrient uptake outer membrane protein [Niabella sp.]HQX21489.1 RagB/SusD family nutrient uptake outer membrane protein [Niabella sp.]HRB36097.1 RagB/SusD family nutrient uptake outer membrane protein [Niabella sp.]
MKYFTNKFFIPLYGAVVILFAGCTKLDETLYDRITSENFLQTRDDVIRDFLRAFEHAYWTIQGGGLFYAQELPGDQLMTPNRDGDWFDGGKYQRAHYHTWTIQDDYTSDMWNALFQGISLATNSLEDIEAVDINKVNITEAEKADFIAELKTLRAWFNLRAFDLYRNIPLVTKVKGETGMPPQATPEETFNFIEKELKDAIPGLPVRQDLGAAGIGRWTKGGAAALLVRLYLNAEVYIGQSKYAECAAVAQDIIDGKYGSYQLESSWYKPFDYDNAASGETIYGFPSTLARTHWHYSGDMYWWMGPHQAQNFFGFTNFGGMNTRYALQPGRDVDSVEYAFSMGKPFIKFQRYSDDFRLKKYKNLGNSQREGMFLYGYLPYYNNPSQFVKSNRGYTIFARDQVGWFKDTPPGEKPADKESNMNHADDNSGIWVAKYPIYPTGDPNAIASAYAEIRLAEVYYSLAECKYRAGDKGAAATLLNAVRKRNYPAGSASLYQSGGVQLNDQEMLDEWGREFLVEGRRRTDLIRWGKFNTGAWWDKQPDNDDHTKIYPIGQNVISLTPGLKQNPGY